MHQHERFLGEGDPVMFTSFSTQDEALDAVERMFGKADWVETVGDHTFKLTWFEEHSSLLKVDVQRLGHRWIAFEVLPGGFKSLTFTEADLA